ncbi:MAG TPA: class I SAM-dependent methyltransferase [Anaerolineales bacterium]|nr:class I SAM-dependent methyltransferase [Anaerolineales bacterium]
MDSAIQLITPEHELALGLDGPISAVEGAHLAHLAHLVPDGGTIVEIGTNVGKSASFMGFGLRFAKNFKAKVHCVDLWSLGGKTQQKNYRSQDKFSKFQENIKRLGLQDVLTGHVAESTEFSKTWKEPIDLLFIDAGHTYEAVRADYESWQGFVKAGGFIAFHDYVDKCPGVVQLIDQEVIPDLQWQDWQQVQRLISAKRKNH